MHPILVAFCQYYPFFNLFVGGNTAFFTFSTDRKNWQRERFLFYIETENADSNSMVIRAELKSQYPVSNVRTKRYAEELAKLMNSVGVEVYITEPRIIGLKARLSNVLTSPEPIDEKVATIAQVYGQLQWALQTMSPIMRFSWRVQLRAGTNGYRKVMPSKLAELTLHGHNTNEMVSLH